MGIALTLLLPQLAGRDLRFLLISYARNAAMCVVTLNLALRFEWGLPGGAWQTESAGPH
jgi:hypothetical protein